MPTICLPLLTAMSVKRSRGKFGIGYSPMSSFWRASSVSRWKPPLTLTMQRSAFKATRRIIVNKFNYTKNTWLLHLALIQIITSGILPAMKTYATDLVIAKGIILHYQFVTDGALVNTAHKCIQSVLNPVEAASVALPTLNGGYACLTADGQPLLI